MDWYQVLVKYHAGLQDAVSHRAANREELELKRVLQDFFVVEALNREFNFAESARPVHESKAMPVDEAAGNWARTPCHTRTSRAQRCMWNTIAETYPGDREDLVRRGDISPFGIVDDFWREMPLSDQVDLFKHFASSGSKK